MQSENISELRRDILKCQSCFVGSELRCLHHEDLVGGYAPGKIVFVGINPQASPTNKFYKGLQSAPDDQKMLLGDHLRHIFAGHEAPPDLRRDYYEKHPGRAWVESSAEWLGLSMHEFAEHTQSVELFKHASAGEGDLMKLGEPWNRMQVNCPEWFKRQLSVLKPRLVVFSGNTGLRFLRDYVKLPLPKNISNAHGSVCEAKIGPWQGPALLTFAVSRQNHWKWRKFAEASAHVKAIIRETAGVTSAPHASPMADSFDPELMFLVESKHEQLIWNGACSTGTHCDGFDSYLHLIPLSADLVERIAAAEWQERGGRKFGPLGSPSGPIASKAKQPDAWFFSKNPSGHFPDVSPRLNSKLDNGRPVPLTAEEVEAIEG